MEKLQRFSIRKLSIGAVSCLIGTVTFLGYSHDVQAAEKPQTVETAKAENEIQPDNTQESKPNEESKGNTQNEAVDKDTVGSQANNAAVVNTSDQSKSEDSSVLRDPDSKDAEVKPKELSNVDTNEQKKKDVTLVTNSPASETNASSKPVQTVSPEQPAAPTTPVTNKASHESNSQVQPSSSINNTQIKLVRRPVMRLAATAATNSDELIVGKDVTISDFSVTAAKGKNEFENSHANIKFTMHADDPSVLVDKRLTIQLGKVWDGFYSSEQRDSNLSTISYQDHVIGTLNYGYPFNFVYITFNNHVKDYTNINLQSDLVVAGNSQNDSLYRTDLYTSTQAKDGQTYYLTNDIVIGQKKYSSNLPSTIHYYALNSEFVSSVTDVTTTSYAQNDRKLYAGTFYKTPNGIYYSQSLIYGGNNLYNAKQGQPGHLSQPDLYVGTDIVTDHTQSYTATFDIDQTKLSPDQDLKFTPITSYYLDKDYWDDKNLLPNTRDVYVDKSYTSSTTVTADATVIKNGVIFNKLNGQSLATRIVNAEYTKSHWRFPRNTNYISYNGRLYITPALFKQLQAVAESDQNLTEAINTVTTTGRDAEIKLTNPIDTGVKATIKTSDGKTKEVPLLIDTIKYPIEIASTAPKGSILVSAQGKTAKVYHPGDQNIPAVVDQSQLTKTITRTINVHEPGKSVTTTKQTVTFTQSVSVVDGKDVTYNGDWKVQGDSQWTSYDVPVIPGYTASQSSVAKETVTGTTKDQTVNITYTANDGSQTISYQDNGQEVGKQVITGKTDQTVKVTPEVPDGYVVKSEIPKDVTIKAKDETIVIAVEHGKAHISPDKPVNKGDLIPDTKDKHYPEGLTHNDLNKTVTREITIIDPTGKKSTTAQTVTFTRGATVDDVTGKVTYDSWSENGKHTFDKVDVPTVPGYTVSGDVPEVVVTPETQSSKVDITYSANVQTATITYVDDTTGETLHTDNPNGVSDQDAKYTTSDTIKKYEDQHYKLVSDSTKGKDLIFDHDDNADQTYEVHFIHSTHKINQITSPKQTIHYVYADDLARQGKAADDNVQQLSFTRDGYNDEVTGIDHWNDWTPANSQYKAVNSPVIQGYTPDKSVIEKSTVNPTDKDTEITIVYNANRQAAHVIYIDKTTNDVLTSDDLSGKSDKDSGYNTKDAIEKYQSQHYVLTGDETKGKNVIFDHDDKQDQTYYVYFVHGTQKVNRQDTVTSTIDYKFEDGKTAQPTVTQTKQFSEDGVKDLVTGKITWTSATPQKFDDIATKSIVGYTPDKDNVTGSTVNFGDKDVEVTVTYHNNAQKAVITYVDDTEKKTLGSDKQNGKFNQAIIFEHDPAEVIKGLEKKGYKLVSDNFKPGIKYQNDNKFNSFEVHLVHTYEPVETSQTITETVHYIDANGKPVAPNHVAKVVIEVTGTRDKVTDSITWNTPSIGHFDEVISPEVPNMTPDKKLIPGRDVQYGDSDITENVVYTPDKTPREPEKPNDQGNPTSKTSKKSNKSDNPTSKTSRKPNKPSKKVSKQFGTIIKTTNPEKPINSRTVDNHASAKSTAKQELPQTGEKRGITEALAGILLASMGIATAIGASRKKRN